MRLYAIGAMSFSRRSRSTQVQHTVLALRGAGLDCVSVAKGDSADAMQEAVKKWREDPDCAVFVLHAGAAAAGLTLTAARHLFLLEPFLSVGEEAQAMNRCHRIGQERSVSTTSYFLRGTAEERLIAYRSREAQAAGGGGGGGTDALSVLATAGDVKKMPHHKLRYLAGLAAFVEDMSDDDARTTTTRRRRAAAGATTTTTTRPPPTAAVPTTEAFPP